MSANALAPEFLRGFGIHVPDECLFEDSTLNLRIERVSITLSHEFPTSPLLEGRTGTEIRIVAIICEEYVVSKGNHFVCIDFKKMDPGPVDFPRNMQFRSRRYIDVIPPGLPQKPFREWYKVKPTANASGMEWTKTVIPELKNCRDLRQCAALGVSRRNGIQYYSVTHEKMGDEIISPLGYVEHAMRMSSEKMKSVVTREKTTIDCPDGVQRPGILLPKKEGDMLLKWMDEWVLDPRPKVQLDTFTITGTSFSPEWTFCATLFVCYST